MAQFVLLPLSPVRDNQILPATSSNKLKSSCFDYVAWHLITLQAMSVCVCLAESNGMLWRGEHYLRG